MVDIELLKQAVMNSRDGITIADTRLPDCPLIFINPAFERLTGYCQEEVVHRNCRFLQGEERDQPNRAVIRDAIARGEPCLVILRNFRKDGSLFWNELSMSPIFDREGRLTHFLGIQKDITSRVLLEERMQAHTRSLEDHQSELLRLATVDGLTGVHNRRYFDTQLRIQWKIAARQRESLALFFIDVDHFKAFNDHYGHPAGDEALRAVANQLRAAFRREADFVARYGGEEFVVLTGGMNRLMAREFAENLRARVQTLEISHRATASGFLTISIGFTVCVPGPDDGSEQCLEMADRALYQAKALGRNRAVEHLGGDTTPPFRTTGAGCAGD